IRLQEGTLRACRTAHYELLIHPCDYRRKDVRKELGSLIEQTQPDGVVLAAPLSNMPRIVAAIAATGSRFVRLSPGSRSHDELCIATDDREISGEMTRYLASLGHRRIAFIAGDRRHKAVARRLPGYRDGLAEGGLDYSEELVTHGDNSIESGEAAAERLLALDDPPTAIFAANDDMAAGVIRVAYRLGLDVPGRLSVAGFDDSALAQLVYPALTTIRQPLAKMAEQAALELINRFGQPEPDPETVVIPSTLQIRESTGPAPS
ncbi:MAG TPA: substrate-binding domain-containing protein, partial [Woeseiaceae bacterium]|nr:substrate-binding domain-containing protein [Woeseiaceae bacterium]